MKQTAIISYLLLLVGALAAYSDDPIVRIGDQNFSKSEILGKMDNTQQDPMLVVDKIKRSKAIESAAKAKKLVADNPENALYQNMLGVSAEEEIIILNDPVLPEMAKKEARLRKMLFDRWVAEFADRSVPVAFLNEKEFWEMVKNCKSYQIRKEQGYETPIGSWEYSWNELLVDPEQIIAKEGDNSFLKGAEFNTWIKENYLGSIRAYAKRKHSKAEILEVLSKKATAGKLMAQKLSDKTIKIKDNFVEKIVDNYIRQNMMVSDFKITTVKGKSYSDALQMIYENYCERAASELAQIRKLLKGDGKVGDLNNKIAVWCANAATGSMQMEIANSIGDSELYDLMKKNNFKGSLHEARQVFGMQKYDQFIETSMSQAGIVCSSFKK